MHSSSTIKRNCVRILQRNNKISLISINGWIHCKNVKLRDTQLKKLKTAVKNKTGTTLRMSLKMLDGNDLGLLFMDYYLQQDKEQD